MGILTNSRFDTVFFSTTANKSGISFFNVQWIVICLMEDGELYRSG